MRKTTLTMPPLRRLHPRVEQSCTRNSCHQLSVPKHLTYSSLPTCTGHPNLPFLILEESQACLAGTHMCTPLLLCDAQFKADLSPLEASCWLLWVLHHIVSGQSHFSQGAVCGFHIQFIPTHSWMNWLSECKTDYWFDYWFLYFTYS